MPRLRKSYGLAVMMRASVTAMNDVLAALEKAFPSLSKFHDLSIVRSKAVETMVRGLFESI